MEVRKTKTVTKEVEELEYIQCDLCPRTSPNNSDWDEGQPYSCHTNYDIRVKYEYRHGTMDGGEGTGIKVDLCPTCFTDKLVPWLREQGAKVSERVLDW